MEIKDPASKPEAMSDEEIDENLKETFPASDPPSWTLGTNHQTESPNRQRVPDATVLRELRRTLLHLHKTLLDRERDAYERAHGRVSSGQLLQLVIGDAHFAWLHSLSELIVSIDELLDAEEPLTPESAKSMLDQARTLLKPAEDGTEFAQKYYAALQGAPEIVYAHRAVMAVLTNTD